MLKLTKSTEGRHLTDSNGTHLMSCWADGEGEVIQGNMTCSFGRIKRRYTHGGREPLTWTMDNGHLIYRFSNGFGDSVGVWDTHDGTVYRRRYAGSRCYRRSPECRTGMPFDEWLDKCMAATTVDPPTTVESEVESDEPRVNRDLLDRYYQLLTQLAFNPTEYTGQYPWTTTEDTL